MAYALFRLSEGKFFGFHLKYDIHENNFYSIYECEYNDRLYENKFDDWVCNRAYNVEKCVKEVHNDCMGFFHRQIPMLAQERYERRGKDIPECLKAFYPKPNDEEFPTLKKLDDELNKLLSNY